MDGAEEEEEEEETGFKNAFWMQLHSGSCSGRRGLETELYWSGESPEVGYQVLLACCLTPPSLELKFVGGAEFL
jgi:hypothetical protein